MLFSLLTAFASPAPIKKSSSDLDHASNKHASHHNQDAKNNHLNKRYYGMGMGMPMGMMGRGMGMGGWGGWGY